MPPSEAYPTRPVIQDCVWSFQTDDGRVIAGELRFHDDGRLSGYEHENEASWSFINGFLALHALDGRVSTRFDVARTIAGNQVQLSGRFLLHPEFNLTMILTQKATQVAPSGTSSPVCLEYLLSHSWLLALNCVLQPYRELIFEMGGGLRGNPDHLVARWEALEWGVALHTSRGQCLARLTTMLGNDGQACLIENVPAGQIPEIMLIEYRSLAAPSISMDFTAERPAGNTRDHFQARIDKDGWEIGEHSYGQPTIFEPHMAKLTIGRFTSIAAQVSIALGNHRTSTTTTYPFASFLTIWPAAEAGSSHDTKGDVWIGSDVWIGTGAFIGSGVTIGDGAVIGAHAVVTKNVDPYMIVGGNPARLIRSRFAPVIIEHLLKIRWWSWDDRTIAARVPELSANPEIFIAKCKRDGLMGEYDPAATDP